MNATSGKFQSNKATSLAKNQIDFRKGALSTASLKAKELPKTPASMNAYQSLTKQEGGGSKQGLSSSSSQVIMESKSPNLVEQAAVAAVPSMMNSQALANGQSNRSGNSSQKFLPTINSNSAHSQAMYAATSPYQSVEEQNIPLQPLSSNAPFQHQGQTNTNDYFNLKQS